MPARGREESHKNDDRQSSSSSGSDGGSQGGREGEGARSDPEAGQCRDESRRFVESSDEPGSGRDPNKQRVASRGGEHSHGAPSSAGRSGRD